MFTRNPRQAPSQPARPYSRIPPDGSHSRPNPSEQRPYYDSAPPEKQGYSQGQSRQGPGRDQVWQLKPAKALGRLPYENVSAVSPFDFPQSRGGDFYLILNDLYVCTARQSDGFPQGQISLSDIQRSWAGISLQDMVYAKMYDPFQEGGYRYLGSLDAEISFAASKKETEAPYDQDELQQTFTKVCISQILRYLLKIYRITKTKCWPPANEF